MTMTRNAVIKLLFAIEWIAVLAILILLIMSEGDAFRTTLIGCSVALLVLTTLSAYFMTRPQKVIDYEHVEYVPGSSEADEGSKGR